MWAFALVAVAWFVRALLAWADGWFVEDAFTSSGERPSDSEVAALEAGLSDDAFVVRAGYGIYFTPGDEGASEQGDQRVWFAGPDEAGVETAQWADPGTLRASPDGRHLAGIEYTSGFSFFGAPEAKVWVYDLVEGHRILETSRGFEAGAFEDLEWYYAELEPDLVLTDDHLKIDAAGTYRFDLASHDLECVEGCD